MRSALVAVCAVAIVAAARHHRLLSRSQRARFDRPHPSELQPRLSRRRAQSISRRSGLAHDPKRLPLSADVMYTRKRSATGCRRWLLEDGGRSRQLQAHLRRSGSRPGGVHGHHAGSGIGDADEPASAHPTSDASRKSRAFYFPPGWRRTLRHPRYGRGWLQAGGHVVQVDTSCTKTDAPGDDCHRRQLLQRPARKNDGRGVNGTWHL